MREHHLTVRRSARYLTLGEREAPEEVWFVCHGYRQLAGRFLRRFGPIDDGRCLIVAPEALNRFYVGDPAGRHGPDSLVGATWMTSHDRLREIEDYVGYLDTLHERVLGGVEGDDVRIRALGFSQAAATASRWVGLGAARVDRLILWAGFLPPDLDLEHAPVAERLRAARLTLVRGADDRHADPERVAAERERLEAHGIPYREVSFPGGHALDAGVLRELARS